MGYQKIRFMNESIQEELKIKTTHHQDKHKYMNNKETTWKCNMIVHLPKCNFLPLEFKG